MKVLLFHTLFNSIFSKTYVFYNQGQLVINNYTYRESINPVFYLYFNNNINAFNLSYLPKYSIDTNSYKSNTPLKDARNKPLLDSIDFYKTKSGFITLLASGYSKNRYNYTLLLDNDIFTMSYSKNLSYFNRIYVEKGSHTLSLMATGFDCYCVSEHNGYTNSYQLGVWDEPHVDLEPIILKNNSLPLKIGGIEFVIDYNYNDLINSHPKSSHTRFHI